MRPIRDIHLRCQAATLRLTNLAPAAIARGILSKGAESLHMKSTRVVLLLTAITALATLAPVSKAQSAADAGSTSNDAFSPVSPIHPLLDLTYRRPSEKVKLRNYFFDAFGPYPIVAAAALGGINQ